MTSAMWYEEMDTDTSEPMEIDEESSGNCSDNLPVTWTVDVGEGLHRQIEVQRDEPDFSEIKTEFKRSFNSNQRTSYRPEIHQIKRIQNPSALALYNIQKLIVEHKLSERNRSDCQVERRVWHGTTLETANIIARSKFDRVYAGTSVGTRFGRGIYFASKAKLADRYAQDQPGQSWKCIILASVITGESYQSRESCEHWKVPPLHDGSEVHRYDSIVDDLDNPRQYVVFNDASAYPEFIILYSTRGNLEASEPSAAANVEVEVHTPPSEQEDDEDAWMPALPPTLPGGISGTVPATMLYNDLPHTSKDDFRPHHKKSKHKYQKHKKKQSEKLHKDHMAKKR